MQGGAGRCREVQGGAVRCREVQGGAGRCRDVQGGAGWCSEVQGGAGRWSTLSSMYSSSPVASCLWQIVQVKQRRWNTWGSGCTWWSLVRGVKPTLLSIVQFTKYSCDLHHPCISVLHPCHVTMPPFPPTFSLAFLTRSLGETVSRHPPHRGPYSLQGPGLPSAYSLYDLVFKNPSLPNFHQEKLPAPI